MVNSKINKIKIIQALILFVTFLSTTSWAQDKPTITVEPPFQEVTLDQNTATQNVAIKYYNNTPNTVEFDFKVLEIKQMDEHGNISFIDRPQTAENPLAWFVEAPTATVIEPNKSITITVTVKNNVDLSPGGHYVAIVATANVDPTETQAQIAPALSTFLLIKKEGGVIYQLSLKPIAELGWILHKIPSKYELTFENQGNSHTVPHGTIEISDIFGKLAFKGIINEGSSVVLPGARRIFEVTTYKVAATYPVMFYTVKISGSTTPGNVNFNQTNSFLFISPITYVALGTGAILIVWLIKKRKHEKQEK